MNWTPILYCRTQCVDHHLWMGPEVLQDALKNDAKLQGLLAPQDVAANGQLFKKFIGKKTHWLLVFSRLLTAQDLGLPEGEAAVDEGGRAVKVTYGFLTDQDPGEISESDRQAAWAQALPVIKAHWKSSHPERISADPIERSEPEGEVLPVQREQPAEREQSVPTPPPPVAAPQVTAQEPHTFMDIFKLIVDGLLNMFQKLLEWLLQQVKKLRESLASRD